MTTPGSAASPLLASAAGGSGSGYQIERSIRFNSSDSAYLSRTPSVAGNRKTWTWAGWVKRSGNSSNENIFSAWVDNGAGNNITIFFYQDDDASHPSRLVIGDGVGAYLRSEQKFRDFGAWGHLVVAADTTLSTTADRIKVYWNGYRITTWNSDTLATNVAQNADLGLNTVGQHTIGNRWYNSGLGNYFSGYLADIHFIDGQALDPTSFGEFDANGVWQPKAYTGTYGTNGFHLPFSDNSTAAALGTDTSGNSNTWTPNNLSVSDGTVSVAAATGALPIYNTTDTYGTAKGAGTRTDSNSSSIVLAIPMDGANNGTTFTDESATIKGSGSAKLITRNGDTKTSTAQSKYYGSSGYFDGNGDYLQFANSTDFNFGTGNFTIEAWVFTTATSGQLLAGYDPINEFNFDANALYFGRSGTFSSTLGATVSTNTWQHIALVRNGSTVTGYVNGVAGSTPYNISTNTVAFTTGTGTLVGRNHISAGTARFFSGYIQDFRIYKGVAKYTSNFNPPNSTQNTTVAAGNDSLVDTPTNGSQTDTGVGGEVVGNYATLNPLDITSGITLSNGNLDVAQTAGSGVVACATWGISSGKWYWEVQCPTGINSMVGIGDFSVFPTSSRYYGGSGLYYYQATGGLYGNLARSGNNTPYGAAFQNSNDIVGVALDMDNGNINFYKNGINQGVANTSSLLGKTITAALNNGGAAAANVINFGQRPFAYPAPSGYKALCTTNLPEPQTITTSGTYTGNGVADGPFVYLNGVPTAMTVNGNAVTFGTEADRLSNGFKVRTTSTTYNQNAVVYNYSITSTGDPFKRARAQSNP